MKHGKSILLLSTLLFTMNLLPLPAYGQAQQLAPQPSSASPLDALELTPEQQKQVNNIRELLRAEIRTILSPAQYEQVRGMQDAGQEPQLSQLDLSKAQKKQIKEAQGLAAYRLQVLLTPAQQQRLQELLRSRR